MLSKRTEVTVETVSALEILMKSLIAEFLAVIEVKVTLDLLSIKLRILVELKVIDSNCNVFRLNV